MATKQITPLTGLALVLGASLFAQPAAPGPQRLGVVRPDVDVVLGFERCSAAPALFARLQDELLFAVGAEGYVSELAELAGVAPGTGVERLLVAVRGESILAIVPSTREMGPDRSGPPGVPRRDLRRLDQEHVALGDLSLLRGTSGTADRPIEATSPSLLARLAGEAAAGGCAWVVALPGWVRPEPAPASDAAEVLGRSLRRSLMGVRGMTLTAAGTAELAITLRVHAADTTDAAILADGLFEFLATRRANAEAPAAVRDAVERGTVLQDAEIVTLQLPLPAAALDRIRHNQDSRTLVRLRLADAEREGWQKVGEIARLMELREGDHVADVGAGEGFFTVRLSRAVGERGRVWAVEIGEKAISRLSRRAAAGSLSNIHPILGAADDPRLPPASLDAVLIVNSYHEMPFFETMLKHLCEALKPGGRLALVEPWSEKRRGEPRSAQTEDHLIAPELAEAELRRAGFEIAVRRDDFVAHGQHSEWLIVARRPGSS